jgi:hypothetical protein
MDRCLSLTFVLYVLWFTASDYPFVIFKQLFLLKHAMFSIQENKQRFNIKIICYNTMQVLWEIDITIWNKDIQNVCLIGEWCRCILLCYFLSIQFCYTLHFFGLMVEVYRRTSRHIKSIFNASVTRFITGHLLTLNCNV